MRLEENLQVSKVHPVQYLIYNLTYTYHQPYPASGLVNFSASLLLCMCLKPTSWVMCALAIQNQDKIQSAILLSILFQTAAAKLPLHKLPIIKISTSTTTYQSGSPITNSITILYGDIELRVYCTYTF